VEIAVEEGQDREVTTSDTGPQRVAKRGSLRIYLGCAPGVGKTYEMLAQAHVLVAEGRDVVAAVVETHGRSATADMLDGIEQVPLRTVEYRGTALRDMDLGAVLARDPQVVLVDELAHSNPPGSRNAKRWEDIADLLEAGIDVLSTVNIQHLESLNDVVFQITGVPQRETVPDDIVRAADEIELVDIAPEALRQRLSVGKVYPGDRIGGALSNYFRQGNLTALRELALLWLADRVDDSLADYRASHAITETWEARERVVVAITGGAESATLLRRATRIASRSSAELVVVHVVRGDGLLDRGAVDMAELAELAKGFRAKIHTVVGDDVPETLLEFARGVNATQLVIGTSRRSRWQRFFDEGVGASVVRLSGKIDVHIVTHDQVKRRNPLDIRDTRFHRPLSWVFAVVIPVAATGAMMIVDHWLGFASESALYFVCVLAVSLLGGIGPAALSAIASSLLLNYFFTAPRYSLTIGNINNVISIVVMLVMAIAVAILVDSASKRRREALHASREAELLTMFSGAILRGADVGTLLERVRETYDQRAVSLVRVEPGRRDEASEEAAVGTDPASSAKEADTVCASADGGYELWLVGDRLGAGDRRVLAAVATQAEGLVQQKRLAEEAANGRAIAETDRLRRALLSAVSHDLRTPLAAVKASVSSLRSEQVEFSPEDTAELLATIEESTDQLGDLVGNLLDSSRLAAGVVRPDMRVVYLTEVLGRAMMTIRRQGARERVTFELDTVVALADPGLLERVFANLVDNALHHGGGPIEVRASLWSVSAPVDEVHCRIEVVDHGFGVAVEDRERMFSAFQRLGDRDSTTGVGLGLSVAQGFVEAMGGTISAADTPGGGLTMIVDLPAPGGPIIAEEADHG